MRLGVRDPVPRVDEVLRGDRACRRRTCRPGSSLNVQTVASAFGCPRLGGGGQDLLRLERVDRGQAVEERLLDLRALGLLRVVRVDVGRLAEVEATASRPSTALAGSGRGPSPVVCVGARPAAAPRPRVPSASTTRATAATVLPVNDAPVCLPSCYMNKPTRDDSLSRARPRRQSAPSTASRAPARVTGARRVQSLALHASEGKRVGMAQADGGNPVSQPIEPRRRVVAFVNARDDCAGDAGRSGSGLDAVGIDDHQHERGSRRRRSANPTVMRSRFFSMMLVPAEAGDMAPPSISESPVPLPECSSTKTIRPTDEIAQTMRAMYEKRRCSRRTPRC